MPLHLVREADLVALTKIRLGIIAKNGVGKTTFVSTIPPEERVFFNSVDVENIRAVAHLKHFSINKLVRWNDLLDVYETTLANLAKPKPPTVLVFDTWSRMQDLAIGKVTGYQPADPEMLRKYIDAIPKSVRGWEGWGQVGSLMVEWMSNFNRLPIHIIYLMQENDRENKFDEVLETGPRLTPVGATGIKDALEIIGRMYVEVGGHEIDVSGNNSVSEEDAAKIVGGLTKSPAILSRQIDPDAVEVRKLFIGQHDRYFAKGPTHLLGRVVSNPTWQNVVVPILTQTPLPEVAAKNGAVAV